MQLAVTALGKVFGGAVGGAVAGGSTALTILQGAATAVSVLGTISAGRAKARQSELLADQADLEAGQERVEGAQRQLAIKSELAKVLGENDQTFANAGIDISAGIAQSARTRANKTAASEISIDRRDQEFNAALFRLRAKGLRDQAKSERGGALLGAIGQGLQFGIDLRERG